MSYESKEGYSLREQAFIYFDLGERPHEVVSRLGIKPTTAYRYFQQWKKLPPDYVFKYKLMKKYYRKLYSTERRLITEWLAIRIDTTVTEILAQMRKPWALKQLVTGEWRQWPVRKRHITQIHRLTVQARIELLVQHSFEARYVMEVAGDQSISHYDLSNQDEGDEEDMNESQVML